MTGLRIRSLLILVSLSALAFAMMRQPPDPVETQGRGLIREVLNELAERPYRLPKVDGLEFYALAAVAAFGLRRLIRSSPRPQADEPTSPVVGPT